MTDVGTTAQPVPVINHQAVVARVTALLEQLGTSANQVGQRLIDGGHFGERHNCQRCPIVNYLNASDLGGQDLNLQVSGLGVFIEFGTGGDSYATLVRLPDPVLDWLVLFDLGAYAELVGGGSHA